MTYKKEELSPFEALWLTIVGEARGESVEGQIAVGNVIKNRLMGNPRYRDYRDVCFAPKQFSCWSADSEEAGYLQDLIDRVMENQEDDLTPDVLQCRWIAQGIDSREVLDNTGGSKFYLSHDLFSSELRPSWAIEAKSAKLIGSQVFFNV